MPFNVRSHPTFSWSHSRDRLYRDCQRAYYHRYYGAHNGHLRDAPEPSRETYILKQITTLPMLLGQLIHERAAEIAAAIRDGNDPPSLEAMILKTRTEMNRVYSASSDREGFRRNPKYHPMLLERYRPINTAIATLKAREKMYRCLQNLQDSPVWEEISRCRRENIHLLTKSETIELHNVTVYAAPDLVWQDGGNWVVLDWKTGSEDEAEDQLALYGLAIRERLGAAPPITARIANLDTAEEREFQLEERDLQAAEARINESVWQMRRHLVDLDPTRNEARGLATHDFPTNVEGCGRCPYFDLCEEDLQNATYLGPF